jgi:glutathione S-transferase
MLRLLGRADSLNVRKVLFALAELGLAHERVDVGGPFGGNRTSDYLSLNPNGLVPTLVDGDVVVWESNAIVRYLGDREGADWFVGGTPRHRAAIGQWMDWQIGVLAAALQPVFWELVRKQPGERDSGLLDRCTRETVAAMTLLDGRLGDVPFLAGDALTAADVAVGVGVHRYFALPLDRPHLPALAAYHERLAARPTFAAHVAIGKP